MIDAVGRWLRRHGLMILLVADLGWILYELFPVLSQTTGPAMRASGESLLNWLSPANRAFWLIVGFVLISLASYRTIRSNTR